MAIAFRAASTLDQPTTANVWTIPIPSGTQDNDLLIAVLVEQTTAITMTAPAGWTIVGTGQSSPGGDSRMYVFRKFASGEGASQGFTWSASAVQSGVACMLAYSGADLVTPITAVTGFAQGNFASGTTPSGPTLTPPNDNSMVLALFGTDHSASGVSWTPPTGYTERVDVQDSGPFCTVHAAEKLQTAKAAETPQATVSTADEGVAFTIAINPAGTTPAGPRSFAVVIG